MIETWLHALEGTGVHGLEELEEFLGCEEGSIHSYLWFFCFRAFDTVAGCVLLNAEMTKLVLVKGWKGNSRGLPKGKINEGEPAIAAALREARFFVFEVSGDAENILIFGNTISKLCCFLKVY